MLHCEVMSAFSDFSVGIGRDDEGPPWRCPPLSLASFVISLPAAGPHPQEAHRPGKVRLQWDEAVEGHPVHVFSGLFYWASSRQLPAAIVGSHPSVSKSWAVGH